MAFGDKSNRVTITFHSERCLHSRSIWASCSLCMDSCPGGAIKREAQGKKPELNLSHCMQCGQCLTACPLEAFDAPDFTERQLISRVTESDTDVIRCFLPYGELDSIASHHKSYQLGTCLASLSPGALFELALNKRELLVTNRCPTCPIFRKASPTMQANLTCAFRMLHSIGLSENLQESTPLFLPNVEQWLAKDGEKAAQEEIRTNIRSLFGIKKQVHSRYRALDLRQQTKHIPVWRLRLRDLWQRNAYLSKGLCSFEWPELVINQNECISCGVCMQMCPTGAIKHSFSGDQFAYTFTPGICSNCGLCISVCTRHVLSRNYRAYEKPFQEKTLFEMPAVSCEDCGKPVIGRPFEPYCFFCASEHKRTPMTETIRAQLGVKSYGDLEKEKIAFSHKRDDTNFQQSPNKENN